MTDQLKNILIGLFVAIAITIAVSLVMFLEPTVGDGKQTLRVRFANVAGISVGTRVTFAGKPVGEVAAISEIPEARELPTDAAGKVYLYELRLKLDSGIQVYLTDEIAIRTTGLMGEKSIAILPKAASKAPLVHNEILFANSIDPLENSVNQVAKAASKLQTTTEHLDTWFVQNQDNLSHSVSGFDQTLNRMNRILGTIEEENLAGSLRASSELLSENLTLLRQGLADEKLLHKTANLVSHLDQTVSYLNTEGAQTLSHLNEISRTLASGDGTIGRFLNSEDFYLRLSSIMGKVETLMNDINHYGVLFQYDKSWQRSRTKRANQLKALETPGEFKTYFEGEVDTIQTALGRLGELLDRASSTGEREKIFQSDAFKENFGSFFRQVRSLSDSIKLYNEDLMGKQPID